MFARFRLPHFIIASALPTLSLVLAASGCSDAGDADGTGGSSTGGTGNPGVGGNASSGGMTGAGGGALSGGAPGAGGQGSGAGGGALSGGSPGAGGEGPAAGGGSNGGGSGGGEGDTGGAPGAGGGVTSGIDDYNPDDVEFVGADCDLPEPALLSSPDHSLPDPFLMPDGSRMSSISQWACQRAWLKKNVEAFLHGEKPGTPDLVTGSVSNTSVSVHVEHGGKSTDFSISINLPSGPLSGPIPAVFDSGSGVPASFLHGEGVASMGVSHDTAEGAFNDIYGNSGTSNQIKWAWYVSRAIDVMVAERDAGNNDIIDPTALGTTGCSFAGKSAFTIGAFDERIALGMPVESGTGGLSSYRIIEDNFIAPNQGDNNPEQASDACSFDSGWFMPEFCSTYRNDVDVLPMDSHFLAAMYAPRGFTTLDNNRIGHLGPEAQYAAIQAAAEVFKALGVESHVGYHGGNGADPHQHCMFYEHQHDAARKAIQGFLTRTAEPDNTMEAYIRDQGNNPVEVNLEDYVNWETPTLN